MDLGLSKLLIPVMEFLNQLVGNYGVAIILFTVLLRIVLVPLDIKQRRSTLKMAELQPKIDAINKKYANDAEKRGRKTMELYKQEKASPFSGCLPMLIQLPLLFAFIAVMRQAADGAIVQMFEHVRDGNMDAFYQMMEQSKFLWIQNIWQPDSIIRGYYNIIPTAEQIKQLASVIDLEQYAVVMKDVIAQFSQRTNGLLILPVIAAGAQFLQSKLTAPPQPAAPANADPDKPNPAGSMKAMMYIFPIMSLYICATYNAAFALYWAVSSILSIILQLILKRVYATPKEAMKEAR